MEARNFEKSLKKVTRQSIIKVGLVERFQAEAANNSLNRNVVNRAH